MPTYNFFFPFPPTSNSIFGTLFSSLSKIYALLQYWPPFTKHCYVPGSAINTLQIFSHFIIITYLWVIEIFLLPSFFWCGYWSTVQHLAQQNWQMWLQLKPSRLRCNWYAFFWYLIKIWRPPYDWLRKAGRGSEMQTIFPQELSHIVSNCFVRSRLRESPIRMPLVLIRIVYKVLTNQIQPREIPIGLSCN